MVLQILNNTQFERTDGSRNGLILLFVLEIGSLAFSRFWYGVRNSYEVVCNSARFFFLKKLVLLKIGKMDQKYSFLN